jgi:hypothetical protein
VKDARNGNYITSSSITQGALVIALIVVFFLFFKGVTNILNALLVPLSLFIFSINKKYSETLLVYLAVFFICVFFFNLQLLFFIFYCAIAFILKVLIHKNINLFLSAVILSITSTIAFWLAIMMTDYIFLTQMGRIMLELLDGNIFVYALMLTAEGILVGVSQLLLSRKIRSLIGK